MNRIKPEVWPVAESKPSAPEFHMPKQLQGDTAWDKFLSFWNFEIVTVDGQPLTPQKFVVALLCIILGFMVARHFSRWLGNRLLPRLGLTKGAIAALQSLTFYLLVVFFSLSGLRLANVPLAMFAVLGGALAIGVGFGSQNLVNNFISGLILLIEQPIKAGDLIEVGGTYGTVEHIGPRSTHVRTPINTHIVVPNSSFLEKDVINWTLSDDLVRTHVRVGVEHGSPPRAVEKLLIQAVLEHERIMKDPPPFVLFDDLGDSALQFEVYFWLHMRRMMERRIIESDVRYRVVELLTAQGIRMAFQQRSVHLQGSKPLEVRILDQKKDS